MYKYRQSTWDKFWKNKNGKIAIWQFPNIPLFGWIIFTVLTLILKAGRVNSGSQFIADAFLFTWSYLEMKEGESYFRRLLGAVVMIAILLSHFR